jgi:chromosome segregation ATPase
MKEIHTRSKGFSSYLAVGKYKGFHIHKDGPSLRIILGWVSICFSSIAIEDLIDNLLKQLNEQDGYSENMEKMKVEIRELQDRVESDDKKYLVAMDQFKRDRDALNQEITENGKKLAVMKKEWYEAEQLHKKTIKDLIESNDGYQDEITDLEAEVESLKSDQDEFKSRAEGAEQENDDLKAKIEMFKEDLKRLEDRLSLFSHSSSSSSSSSHDFFSSSSSSSSSS